MAIVVLALAVPATARDDILVPSDPALTQGTMGQAMEFVRWLCDYTFTGEQRREFQDVCIEGWRKTVSNRQIHEHTVQFYDYWDRRRRQLTPFYTNFRRVRLRTANLPGWEKCAYPDCRWLVKLYRSLQEPGAPGNAVLAEADSPLTEAVVRRYADYLEFVLDFSVTGELTAAQRAMLKEYLVKDW
jgi:hypothetical protein